MIPVLVINLARDIERHERMQRQLSALGIPFQLIHAVDGRSIPPEEAKRHMDSVKARYDRPLTAGELGCALTHMRLLRRIADGPYPFVCVMEDDIALDQDIVKFLDESTITAMPSFDILRLYSNIHRQHKPAWHMDNVHGRAIVAPLRIGWGTQAQVFTRAAARRIAVLPITASIDHMLYYRGMPGLRVIEIRPALVDHLDREYGSSTSGWEAWPKSVKHAVITRLEPLVARINFVRTWGLRGVIGLIRSRYRPGDA